MSGRVHWAPRYGNASILRSEDDAHDALHVAEPLGVKVVGDLDVFMRRSGDLESKPRAGELDQLQAEVACERIVIVGLDVADAAVILFELSLNEEVGAIGSGRIDSIVTGVFTVERDLEIFVTGLSDRDVLDVQLHGE